MLVPVALQHSGFRVPGLYQDGRGVVVGSVALLLLPSRDRLLSLLRLLAEEPELADLLPTIRLEELRNAVGARGYLLRLRTSDSRLLDRFARAAALCFGSLFVGAELHFLAYRDRSAPLGYDVAELSPEPADYILYTPTATQSYRRLGELALTALLGRMQLLLRPGGAQAALQKRALPTPARSGPRPDDTDELWLLVPLGLLSRTLRLLWERGLPIAAALPEPLPAAELRPPSTAATDGVDQALIRLPWTASASALLLRLLDAAGNPTLGPRRLRALVPLDDHLAVELGYAQPLRLLPFSALFDRSQRHLFLASSPPGRSAADHTPTAMPSLLALPATPFVAAERLLSLTYAPLAALAATPLAPMQRQPAFAPGSAPLQLPLRLAAEPTPGCLPSATLVPWPQLRPLGRLLRLLPPTLLLGLRAVAFDEGILLVAEADTIANLPLGLLLYAAAPSVLVPSGMALVPRLRGDLLRAQLTAPRDHYVVFLPDRAPFAFAPELLVPASAQLVARLPIERREPLALLPPDPDPHLVNDPLGLLWPLWGARLPTADEPPDAATEPPAERRR